jgi:hypothetical protein
LLNAITLSAQKADYQFKREITGINAEWHLLNLPNEVFGKIRPNFSDIRILGITPENDTVEAPYLVERTASETSEKELVSMKFNSTHNEKGYFFTFEMEKEAIANQIVVDFLQKNFDWKVKVEGSQNQNEWFTLVEDYRILSILNEQTKYAFKSIIFPDAKYRFFRLCVNSPEKPVLLKGYVSQKVSKSGEYRAYSVKNFSNEVDKAAKQTILYVELPNAVPVSYLKFAVANKIDFYRPLKVEYLVDSQKTEKGYFYNYALITSGTLSSLEKDELIFANTLCKKLKITLENADNEPLKIDSVWVKGTPEKLIARFNKKANYFLFYGNPTASAPRYDIAVFQNKIPANLTEVSFANELSIKGKEVEKVEPLFQNKTWLWAIMAIIIAVLGWFSFKMLGSKE